MVAFFCSTPYQILLAINIKYTMYKDEEVDIYVLNHFNKANETADRLESENIFHSVKLVNCLDFSKSFSENRIIRFFQKIKKYLEYKKLVNQYFQFEEIIYDEVYLTYPDVIIQLAIKELFNRNPSLKIQIYEDGTGGYSSDILNTTTYKKLFNKITGFGNVLDKYNSIMMFMPELYSGKSIFPKVQIPLINKDDTELKDIINSIFDYKNQNKIEEKIIFLEQPMTNKPGLNEKIRNIADNILLENYIIKLHPRSRTEDYRDHNVYQNNEFPWEIICLNNDIEGKILISYYSTANISNKIIFDKEPVIIFLYEMEELTALYQISLDTKKFVNKFKNTYRNPSKIFTPKNMNELKQYLNEINLKDNFL